MSRLDLALRQFPAHADGVRLLAERDPSGKLKYLDWGAKMLAAEQALAPEVADVLDLYHRFRGQFVRGDRRRGSPGDRVHPDIHAYRPQDFAALRDRLLAMKRAQDRKQKKRDKLYRIEGAVDAEVIYDSPDLVVRHVKNKAASVHYGLGTKWCVSMLRAGYFEDYDAQNATFFFFERRSPVGDDFDKVAVMVPRTGWDGFEGGNDLVAFTAADRQVGLARLARAYGPRVFDIFRLICECSDEYPGSVLSQIYAGSASAEQVEAALANITTGPKRTMHVYELTALLESVCCNDAAPQAMLEEVERLAGELVSKASRKRRGYHYNRIRGGRGPSDFATTIEAALAAHPNTSDATRERLVKKLRRRHVAIENVRRVTVRGRVGIAYDKPVRLGHRFRRRRSRFTTAKQARAHAAQLERRAARLRKSADAMERKVAAKKAKAAKAAKKKTKGAR